MSPKPLELRVEFFENGCKIELPEESEGRGGFAFRLNSDPLGQARFIGYSNNVKYTAKEVANSQSR